jgi:hypothetical protein
MRTSDLKRPATLAPGGSASVSGLRPVPSPWLWLVGGAVVFFAVPFLGTNVVGLEPDDARCGARESACGLRLQ